MKERNILACLVTAILDQKGILPNSLGGLLERIAIIIGWGWIACLAIGCLHRMHASVSPLPSAGEGGSEEYAGQA